MRIRSSVVLSAAAALIWGALLPAPAHAAGGKSSGTVAVVDDLLGGAAACVKATGGGRELDGAILPVAALVTGALTPDTTAEAGYFSRLVSTPAAASFQQVFLASMSISWTVAVPPNPSGSLYQVVLSTAADFSGVNHATGTFGSVVVSTGLQANTSYYASLKVEYMEGDDTVFLFLGSTVTLANIPASAASTFTAVNTNSMSVAWSANGNPVDVTTYTVVLSTGVSYPNSYSGNVSLSTAPVGAFPMATVSGLVGNTTYFLFVNAVNLNGIPTAYTALGSTATLANITATAV
ncbi:MAG: fibronectin type III domain-containing protein, partial [Elusimicrobiota bacterium]